MKTRYIKKKRGFKFRKFDCCKTHGMKEEISKQRWALNNFQLKCLWKSLPSKNILAIKKNSFRKQVNRDLLGNPAQTVLMVFMVPAFTKPPSSSWLLLFLSILLNTVWSTLEQLDFFEQTDKP